MSSTSASHDSWRGSIGPIAASILFVGAIAGVLAPYHETLKATTVALSLLLGVLVAAMRFGVRPAVAASVVAALAFNFFFLPPFYTFTIADPQNWVALFAFLATAVTVGQLSARAKRRAEDAVAKQLEIERLYTELRDAFDRASRAEALRQAEQMKSTLLDAVTHDLRTPLTAIKASVSTLMEPVDDATRRELLTVIDEESERLDRSISGIVEIARIEAGQMEFRRRWTAPDEIVSDVVTRAARATANHSVTTDIEPSLPMIFVDGRAVSEALYAVLDNAAKYAPAGTAIGVTATPDGESAVCFSVIDEGPGISEELSGRVFEKFVRGGRQPSEGANSPSGTGMGLAIARGIVEAHNGRIWIASNRSGRGVTVAFSIPVGEDDAGEAVT